MSPNDFDRFVADNGNGLLRTAYLMVGDLHEAEDLVQETLFKVASRWPRVSRMENLGGLHQADPRQPGVAREIEAVTQPSGAESNPASRDGR